MPEVLREGPYRFLFYANEGNEPHTSTSDETAKLPNSGWTH